MVTLRPIDSCTVTVPILISHMLLYFCHRMTPLFGTSAGWSNRRPSMLQQLMSQIAEKGERWTGLSFEEEWEQRMSVLDLVDVAIDIRPALPDLVSQYCEAKA